LHITGSAIELLDGALECAQRGFLAGGLKKNREFIGNCVVFARNFPADLNQVLFDPQTSGGLLASIASDQVEAVRQAFNKAGCPCIFIGEAVPQTSPMITVF